MKIEHEIYISENTDENKFIQSGRNTNIYS